MPAFSFPLDNPPTQRTPAAAETTTTATPGRVGPSGLGPDSLISPLVRRETEHGVLGLFAPSTRLMTRRRGWPCLHPPTHPTTHLGVKDIITPPPPHAHARAAWANDRPRTWCRRGTQHTHTHMGRTAWPRWGWWVGGWVGGVWSHPPTHLVQSSCDASPVAHPSCPCPKRGHRGRKGGGTRITPPVVPTTDKGGFTPPTHPPTHPQAQGHNTRAGCMGL